MCNREENSGQNGAKSSVSAHGSEQSKPAVGNVNSFSSVEWRKEEWERQEETSSAWSYHKRPFKPCERLDFSLKMVRTN